MRDKVKRFISILMTALMLVNLLPVGALAEGVMISNSVQSIRELSDGYPVFVFVEVTGNTDGLTMNSDKWFTLGMVKSMDGVTKPPKPVTGYQDTINGVTAKDVTAVMTRYKPNESINLGGITWKGFKSEHGASNTYPAYTNQACWHLDGSIRIEDLQVDYTIRYVDENNKEIASSKKKTDKAGSWTKLEKEDIKDITGYTYTDRHDPMQKLVGGKDTVINVYYTTNSYEYKVEHYYDGEIDPSRTDTIRALYGSTVEEYNLELKPKGGYEHETTVNCPLTITEDESKNVIKVYYTKKTDLSYTVNYLEKDTNKVLHNPKVQDGMTFGAEITSASEKIDIDGYNYDSVDKDTLTIGTGENVINVYYTKRNDLSYTVNYLEKVTNKVLHDQKVQGGMTYEDTITSANEKIDISGYNYDSVDPETLTIGTGENVINVYYTKRNDLSYTVNYLEKVTNKVLHDQKVQGGMTYEDTITSANEKIDISGYNYDSVDPETLTIGTGENVINIYYTKRNDLSYTVNYLEKDTLNVLHNPKVQDGMTFDEVVNSADEVIEINGYNYDSVVPEETLTIGTGENVINIYYTKKTDLSYTVNYLEKGTTNVLHEAKTVENQTFGTEITSASEKIDISGYNYDSASPETLTIQADESKNVINLYYTKKTDLSYTVNYYWNGTNPLIPIKNSESGTETYGKTVNPDTDVPGYTLVPGQTTSLEIKDDPDQPNVLNLYYYKNVKLKANDTSRVYNGAKQTILSSEEYTVITTLDNQVVETTFDKEINVTGSGTDVGSNYTMYFPKKEIGIHNEQYYVVGYENGKLSITKRPVTLTSGSAERVYNGEALTKNEVTASTGENEGFVKGQGATYNVTGSQTDVGESKNTFTYKLNGNTNANNYSIELVLGKLEVTPVTAEVIVTITGRTDETTYDGKPHFVFGFDAEPSNKLYNPNKDMQFNGFDEDMIAEGTDAGQYNIGLTAEDFTNKSKNFSKVTFVVTDGYVKITPRPVTLTSETAGKTYDGTALEKPVVTVGGDGFVEGQVTEIKATGSVTNAGSVANTITFTPNKETFKEGNYAITKTEGTLTIAKRSVLITSQSATKTYDGSALTRPAVTITGDGFVPGELAKAEATGSITKVGSTPNAIRYTTTGAFNAANYSIALSVGTLTVTDKPKPEPRRTFNLTINYVYQNGKRAAASYNRGGLKNGETFDITSPVIAGYTASETVVSGTIYNRDIKVTVIYTADGVNLDDYGVPLGLGNITMNVGDCFE